MTMTVWFKNGQSALLTGATEARFETIGESEPRGRDRGQTGLAGLACYDGGGKRVGHFVLSEIVGYEIGAAEDWNSPEHVRAHGAPETPTEDDEALFGSPAPAGRDHLPPG